MNSPKSVPAPEMFRRYACTKLDEYMRQIERCASLLNTEQIWRRPNERSNSVGNLLLHLRGNVDQWIVCGLEGREPRRDRPAEFAHREHLSAQPLVANLRSTVDAAAARIQAISDDEFSAPLTIQGYGTTVLVAVFHAVEHFAFHAGQIIFWTKALLDVDLSLYDQHGRRLDGRADGLP